MSKMSQLHASMSDSYAMGVEEERERVMNIINVGLQVADILGAVDVLKMMSRMVSEGVEISSPKKNAEAEDAFNQMFDIRPGLDSLTIRKKEEK